MAPIVQMPHRNQINHRNPRNQSFGFTIAEMIIVIGILSVMTAVGTRTYFAERDRFEFNNTLIKTMQMVKSVRTYATTSFPIFVGGKNIIPKGGYGINVQWDKDRGESTLTVFANLGAAPNYQEDDGLDTFNPAPDGPDKILETYTLPKQIIFKYFRFKKVGSATDDRMWKDKTTTDPAEPTATVATMFFKPPVGDMAMTGILKATGAILNLERLSLQFENPDAGAAGPKKCQRLILNRIKAFPELLYEATCP